MRPSIFHASRFLECKGKGFTLLRICCLRQLPLLCDDFFCHGQWQEVSVTTTLLLRLSSAKMRPRHTNQKGIGEESVRNRGMREQ